MPTLKPKKKILSISEIKPYPQNAKIHTPEQIQQLKKSIEENEYLQPILVDKNNVIITGHGRYFAIKEMGQDHKIEVIDGSHLTPKQAKKFRILDNKIISNDWDMEKLKNEVEGLYKELSEIDLIMAETGINLNEINFNHGDHDYQDIEKTFNEMDGYDAVKIIIEIPAKYQDQVIEFIANGEDKTLKGYGRGVLKRCGLL